MSAKSTNFWGHVIAATFAPFMITIPVFLSVAGTCLIFSPLNEFTFSALSFLAREPLSVPAPIESSVTVGLLIAGVVHLICVISIMRGKCDPKPHDALDNAMIAEMRAGTFHHPTLEDKERMSEDEFTRRSLAFQEWRKTQEKKSDNQ